MKEVLKTPLGLGEKCCGLKKGTEKWISGREIIERAISRGRVFFDGKELKELITINNILCWGRNWLQSA